MPAVYAIDLIAQRDKKNKMNSSIIKGWNVHYQTLEEAENAQQLKQQKLESSKKQEEQEKPVQPGKQEEPQAEMPSEEAYNAKTGSYSGHYGKKPVHDEEAKSQINAILSEKTDAFHAALSELQGQDSSGQSAEQ